MRILFLLLISLSSFAQVDSVYIVGVVKDALTREVLPGSFVRLKRGGEIIVVRRTDETGSYKIQVATGEYTIEAWSAENFTNNRGKEYFY